MAKKVVKTTKVVQPKPKAKSTIKFDTKTKYPGATYSKPETDSTMVKLKQSKIR